MLIADNEDELTLVFDLAIHSPRNARSRAIDRYRKAARLQADSDEAKMLDAMCGARFSIWYIERRHEIAGFIVTDLMRNTEAWLIDENLEQTGDLGMAIATRLSRPEAFSMTCGVAVPVDGDIIEDAMMEMPPGPHDDPERTADNPRFAMNIYRIALEYGAMGAVAFE